MLQIKNLSISLSKDLRTLLQDFTFSLNYGDKVAVIGEEGNGKSTLLKLIYNSSLVDPYIEYSGEILRNSLRFGYLAQELSPNEIISSVYEFFSKDSVLFDCSPKDVSKILKTLSLPSDFCFSEQPVQTLSGGERVKMQLAKILMTAPDVLLLDEPSNDIDIDTLRWLEQFILNCTSPIMYVSHDTVLIEKTANVIIHIEQLRRKTVPRHTIARTSYSKYIEVRNNNISRQTQISRKEHSEFAEKIERLREIEQNVNNGLKSVSRSDPHGGQLLKKKMKSIKSMEKRFEKEESNLTEMPDFEEAICMRFPESSFIPNGKTVLNFKTDSLINDNKHLSGPLSLDIIGPDKICIIGNNGLGKTTLLKMIANALLPRNDINCFYMPQNYDDVLYSLITPVEFLAPSGKKEEITRAKTFLGNVKYTADEMNHPCSNLSGGQRAKLFFIKMILQNSNVLILDEPTRNFSPLSTPIIIEMLSSFGGAVICVSHDRNFIKKVFSKIYRLSETGLEEVYEI